MNGKAKGYILAAIAAATYGMNPLFALPLYQTGMDPDSVLFFRYLFAIPILGIMIKARGRDFKIQQKEILPLIALGLLVALSSLTLFQSYNFMDAGIASTLLFVYPIMVALIMVAFFKEKMTLLTILCILMALGGIALLFKGGGGGRLYFEHDRDPAGDGFGLIIRYLYRRSEPSHTKRGRYPQNYFLYFAVRTFSVPDTC